jgi:integrase
LATPEFVRICPDSSGLPVQEIVSKSVTAAVSSEYLQRMAENLVKRGEVWYYREQRKGKGVLRTLKTRDRREAKRLAAQMKEKLDRGDLSVRVKQEYPTVGDCYAIYIEQAKSGLTRASYDTARSNFLSLCSVLRHSLDKKPHLVTEEEIKAIKLNAIKPGTTEEPGAAQKFQKFELARGRSARSINSTWRHAVSLFTVQMMGQYALEKFNIPAEFIAFLKSPMLKAKTIDKFDPMTEEEVKRLLEATTDLAISGKPFAVEMAKTVHMAYYLGMRAKEILMAKKRDFTIRDGKARLHIDTVKGGNPRTIIVSDKLKDLLYSKDADKDAFIIADSLREKPTLRYDLIYRHTNVFLRDLLETEEDKKFREKHDKPAPRKLLHHLRKQAGAVLVTRYGLYYAQEFLGHKNPQVTNMFYSALLQDLKSIDEVQALDN